MTVINSKTRNLFKTASTAFPSQRERKEKEKILLLATKSRLPTQISSQH